MTPAEREEELSKARWGGPSLCVGCEHALAAEPRAGHAWDERFLSMCDLCQDKLLAEMARLRNPYGKPQFRGEEEPDNDRNLGLADDFEHQANAFNAERAAQEEK